MVNESYKKALSDAITEYRELVEQRTLIDQRIAQLRETIITLMRLLGRKEPIDFENFFDSAELAEAGESEAALSEAITDVLKAQNGFISARDVMVGLIKIGFDVERYDNPLPSITTTLARLVRNGDALKSGANYAWNTSAFKHSPLKYINQERITGFSGVVPTGNKLSDLKNAGETARRRHRVEFPKLDKPKD